MLNVLIPAMGKSLFFQDSYFPKPMIEIAGKTMLEHVVDNYQELRDKHFVFVFDHKDCAEFHLDDSARILTEPETDIIVLENQTAGALCTCLMAVKHINNEAPLIIVNCDQTLDVDYNEVIRKFENEGNAAGIITFDSIHPRWSYAKVINEEVVEVAEKRPLSKCAIAGFYYFRHGYDFVEAAKKVILKDRNLNGKYYISATLNEIVLEGGRVGNYEISRDKYNTFYSREKIKDYEEKVRGSNENC